MTTEHIHVVKQSTVPHAAHTVVHARPGDDQLDPASTHTAAAAPNATGKLKDRAVPPKEHW